MAEENAANETLKQIVQDVVTASKQQGCISTLPKTGYHTGSIMALVDEDYNK